MSIRKITQSAFLAFYVFCSSLTYADDTEVYFSGAAVGAGTGSGQPNVLLILDTSTSMIDEVVGTGKSRLEHMREAVNNILDNTSNINVGLMRFHEEGGPVLFPVAGIDDDISLYEATLNIPEVDVRISANENDAIEAEDGNVSIATNTLNLVDAPAGIATHLLELQINNGANDAEESQTGSMYLLDSDLELTSDIFFGTQTVGLRFEAVSIPPNATITDAYLEFEIDEFQVAATNLNIAGDLATDSAAFSSAAFDLTSRTTTTNTISWPSLPILGINSKLQSPNVSSVLQELVDQPGWLAGNAISLILSGSGKRTVESFESEPANAAKLVVTYQVVSSSSSTGEDAVGLRFDSVQIPQGATVQSASLQFFASGTGSSTTPTIDIHGHYHSDSPTFTETSFDITNRTTTTSSVNWSPPTWNAADEMHTTPDITSVVQEIVNRSDWCGGNAMSFILTGDGAREAHSFDGDATLAPKLVVNYDETTIPTTGGCINQSLRVQISEGSDDAEEAADGSVVTNSADLELVEDTSTQIVGLRFRGVNIAQGTTVLGASLTLTADETTSVGTTLTISAEDIGSAAPFASTTNNISSRTKTSASANWTVPTWATLGERSTSPDIANVIQAVVNRSDWVAGNDIVLIVEGSGKRVAESFEGSPAFSAALDIQVQGMLSNGTGTTVKTVRDRLKQEIDNIEYKNGTPIVSTLFEATRYYRGEAALFGAKRGDQGLRSELSRLSHPASYTLGSGSAISQPTGCTDANLDATECRDEFIDGTATYTTPIDEACQANYVVLLSDGDATSRHGEAEIESMLGYQCDEQGDDTCGVELADFLLNTDQNTSLTGDQNITTYTVGFNFSGELLPKIATAGGGHFYEATTAQDLTVVFENIIADILGDTSTFLAPAVTINAFNRLTHRDELMFALFKPTGDADWPGNVKRYKLNGGNIVDVNGNNAIDVNTGFFSSTAKSWWSTMTDGAEVEQGGILDAMPLIRNLFTYTDASEPSSAALNTSANLLHEDNAALTNALLDIDGATTDERQAILQWMRGIDIKDKDGDGDKTDITARMGDPLHSKPLLVTYGGTEANPDITLFATTNHGFLHAFSLETGAEQFAFMPQSLLPNINRLFENAGANHPYGLDGPLTVLKTDLNNNGLVDTGDKVYLYVGMRRGGQQYFALDVTDRANPVLMWRIDGGTGDFAELGQTWSRMIPTKIKINDIPQDVLVFAAGYDQNQDTLSPSAGDVAGRGIFMVNAVTGALVWSAAASNATLENSSFTHSIPADLQVIDIDADGFADTFFAADTGAQVWRFDINDTATNASELITGGVIANLGGTGAENQRRFFYPPDIALIRVPNNDFGDAYFSVSIGSGYRAHPLETAIHDQFYSWRDHNVYQAPDSDGDDVIDYTALSLSDFYDATANVIGEGSDSAAEIAMNSLANKAGWLINLAESDGSFAGEKVLSETLTVGNKVIFTTYTPSSSTTGSCTASQGKGKIYVMSVLDATPVLNLDKQDTLEDLKVTDRVKELKRGAIPPEPAVIFPPDDSPPVTLVGTEVIEEIDLGNLFSKKYWRQE